MEISCNTGGCDYREYSIDLLVEDCVDECTWTPGFWKNHPEEICVVLGGNWTRSKGKTTCTGSGTLGFNTCDGSYTLTTNDIICLFNYGSRKFKSADCDNPESVEAIASLFAGVPNGQTLLGHLLAAKLNMEAKNGVSRYVDIGDLICVDVEDGTEIPDIFYGGNMSAGEISSINFCVDLITASDASYYIELLTAYNECNNTCDKPSVERGGLIEQPKHLDAIHSQSFDNLNVYPNPTRGNLQLEFQLDNDREVTLQVMDLNGQIKMIQQLPANNGFNSHSIDVSELPAGVYTIQLSDGQTIKSQRFLQMK